MEEISGSDDNAECNETDEYKLPDTEKIRPEKEFPTSCKPKRSVKRKLKTFTFGKWHKGMNKEKAKKRKTWNFKLNQQSWQSSSSIASESSVESVTCICTGYRKTKMSVEQNVVMENISSLSLQNDVQTPENVPDNMQPSCSFTCSPYEQMNKEITPGDPIYQEHNVPPNRKVILPSQAPQDSVPISEVKLSELTQALRNHLRLNVFPNPLSIRYQFCEIGIPYNVVENLCERAANNLPLFPPVHTQVDYAHYLVPNLFEITSCSFYWGKIDRYKAEKQLEKKPEGTFLLRDSAQEEFVFSVSFRRYRRTLHARIEQLNHKFSFDSHDPNVFASSTVCGLIEHYKNPSCCMFFEPMLTLPVHRNFPFSLQHLCRAVISDCTEYNNINKLTLPKKIKSYLKEYHYKQRIRVRNLDNDTDYLVERLS